MSNSLGALPLRQRKPLRISTDIPLLVRGSPSNSSSSSSSPSHQHITPVTTPGTGTQCFFHALCMHDFESSDSAQLSFHRGEVLTIVKQEHSGWWAAMRPQGDRLGWIPSSFVMAVDGNKILGSSDESLAAWSHDNLNDPPLSAIYDQWLPAYDDHTALAFRLVSPSEPTLYNGFFENRLRNHGHEPHFSLHDEHRSDMKSYPLPGETGGFKLNLPTNLPPLDTALKPHPRPHRIDAQALSLDLLASATPNLDAPQLTRDISDSTSQNGNHSEGDGQPQHPRLSEPPAQGSSKFKSFDLAVWEPENLAEQLCILVHTFYAAIRPSDCFNWIMIRKHTGITGLRCFYDMHEYIASWVQTSILAHHSVTQQTRTLDFWIRVAERCQALRNFDTSCGIILALSAPSLSSLAMVWAGCVNKRTFVALRNIIDSNEFHASMEAVTGPSVPFVRGSLDRFREQRLQNVNESSHATVVSALLRHQSSPYDFKITKALRSLMDDES